jgi:hypothetical protein
MAFPPSYRISRRQPAGRRQRWPKATLAFPITAGLTVATGRMVDRGLGGAMLLVLGGPGAVNAACLALALAGWAMAALLLQGRGAGQE